MPDLLLSMAVGAGLIVALNLALIRLAGTSAKLAAAVTALITVGLYVPYSIVRWPGGDVFAMHLAIYLLASLATAAAVTQAGAIGFIGLIVPHLVRLAAGNDQRLLLPASALAGGSLLVVADTLARTLVAPQQLPVGVLTALIGVPVFLFLLTRDARTRR